MIRPWYRSRLFWLGVPGLVFLIWLSFLTGRSFFLTFGDSTNQFSCDVESGRVMVFSGGLAKGITSPLTYFAYGEGPQAPSGMVKIPPPLTWMEWKEAEIEIFTYREIKVALWPMLVFYLLAWLGLLVWWHRRKSRSDSSP